jgi:hypothetical protein
MIEKRHLEKRLCYQELVQQVPMLIGKNKRK